MRLDQARAQSSARAPSLTNQRLCRTGSKMCGKPSRRMMPAPLSATLTSTLSLPPARLPTLTSTRPAAGRVAQRIGHEVGQHLTDPAADRSRSASISSARIQSPPAARPRRSPHALKAMRQRRVPARRCRWVPLESASAPLSAVESVAQVLDEPAKNARVFQQAPATVRRLGVDTVEESLRVFPARSRAECGARARCRPSSAAAPCPARRARFSPSR